MNGILQFDRGFCRLINATWQNTFFDWLMPFLRIPAFWVPLYIFLLVFIILNVKKNAGLLILFTLITITLTDQVSSSLIKPFFHRLRPCADEAIAAWHRSLINCPINSSFTSSHAVNHFGLAMFFYFTLKEYLGKYASLFFVWAFAICYAQVYVGVHYPLDVICGGILGCMLGYFTAFLYKRILQYLRRKELQNTI